MQILYFTKFINLGKQLIPFYKIKTSLLSVFYFYLFYYVYFTQISEFFTFNRNTVPGMTRMLFQFVLEIFASILIYKSFGLDY